MDKHRSKGHLATAAHPLKLAWHFQHMQHSMMDNHLSKGHLTTAANPTEVDLILPTQATFNDGRSSFRKTPDNSGPPPEVDLTLPAGTSPRSSSGTPFPRAPIQPPRASKAPNVCLRLSAYVACGSGVFLKVDLPSLNVVCAGGQLHGGLQLLSGVLLNDGSPPSIQASSFHCISQESNPGHIDGNDVFCH